VGRVDGVGVVAVDLINVVKLLLHRGLIKAVVLLLNQLVVSILHLLDVCLLTVRHFMKFDFLQVFVLRDELVFLEEAQLPDQVEKLEVLLLIVQVLV